MDLILKSLFHRGGMTGMDVANSLHLPFVVLDKLLLDATQRHFVEVQGASGHGRGGYSFVLTEEGHNRALTALSSSQYVGPAPVPLERFKKWVRIQSVRDHRVTRELLEEAFSDLVLSAEVTHALGPAVNSGASIFLHGAPGNGKTAIAERLGTLISSEIYLPHAILVDGHVIVLYDPVFHRKVPRSWEEEASGGLVRPVDAYDRRFVRIKRPTVFVGGELSMDQLDLQMSEFSKVYRAPFQVKASGGVLIVDDFGRQRMSPAELLNRWIVPLELGFDNLTLDSGVKFPVPFDCILIFATNLDPGSLLDEAFLRRIQFKVEIRSPDRESFARIFEMNCEQLGIDYKQQAVELLYREFYEPHGIEPRGCHPRDILHHLQSVSQYEGVPMMLEADPLRRAARSYFLVMEETFTSGIPSISPHPRGIR
jgi:predicted ATPase with chaperone activity